MADEPEAEHEPGTDGRSDRPAVPDEPQAPGSQAAAGMVEPDPVSGQPETGPPPPASMGTSVAPVIETTDDGAVRAQPGAHEHGP